jgi:uncharacterized membrane protein
MSSEISLLVPCGIIAVASVPLMLNLVPRNNFYGFRTQKTLANDEVWFRANRFAGCALFLGSAASACVLVGYPEYSHGLTGLAVFVVPLFAALAASLAYVRALR